ncbi:hypothetical protein COOONC_16163 [Cooperia oncophora]
MNPNESFLSTISTTNTGTPLNDVKALARIMANVVDMQQHLVSQYQTVANLLESLKVEVHSSTQSVREELKSIRDELRRTDVTHANEITRLMELVKMLVQAKDQSSSAPQSQPPPPEALRMTPAQLAYANAAPPGSFFGTPAGSFNDLAAQAQAHYAACYLQQLQEQQRMRSAGMQATGFFGNQPSINMGGIGGIPGAFSQSQHPAAAAAPPLAPPAVAAAPKPSAGGVLGTVPPVTAAAPVPSSSTGFPITFTSTAPVTTAASLPSSAPSVTSTSSVPSYYCNIWYVPFFCSLVASLM